MRILITGGAGYVATALVDRLKKEHTVSAIIREANELESRRWSEDGARYDFVDISDAFMVEKAFRDFKPDIVIHPAALKLVGLCEENPSQAITDDVIGNKIITHICHKYSVKLVFISTDKAVLPTTVYGATKLIGERLASMVNGTIVRLVNIKGSGGTIIPKWEQLISEGKKVVVYSRTVSRYMMSLQEAVDTICEAALNDYEGKIVLPKKRELVNIYDFAVSLHGTDNVIITEMPSYEKEEEQLYLDWEKNIVEI